MQGIRLGPSTVIVRGICICLLLCGIASSQQYFYETTFIGVNIPNDEDCSVVSVLEVFPGGLAGKFIDFTSIPGVVRPAVNTAAALDMNTNFRPPWLHPSALYDPIYPTGHLAVAKNLGANAVIDFFAAWNGDVNWQLTQYRNFMGPQGFTWSIPTASQNTAMAMEVANGFTIAGNQPRLFLTDYLITAEVFQGTIALGAYGLTDIWGNLVQPAIISWTGTGLQGNVVGMAIAVGNVNPVTAERTQNEIILAVQNPPAVGPITLHSIIFDTRTAAFGALNGGTAYATPFNLTAATGGSVVFGGLSIARNYQSTFLGAFTHDVAVSMANVNNPFGLPGDVFIFQPNPAAPPPPIQVQGVGGGSVCHVPGADAVAGSYIGVANATFNFPLPPNQGGGPPGPFGWFVVTPGAQYTILALDGAGAIGANFLYIYPQGATPNGPPMSHPGGQSIVPNPALRAGTLWIPYVVGGVPGIDFVEGQFFWNGPVAPVPHAVAALNFPGQPLLLKPNQPWPVNAILRGVAFLNEYGLYLQGY